MESDLFPKQRVSNTKHKSIYLTVTAKKATQPHSLYWQSLTGSWETSRFTKIERRLFIVSNFPLFFSEMRALSSSIIHKKRLNATNWVSWISWLEDIPFLLLIYLLSKPWICSYACVKAKFKCSPQSLPFPSA